MTSAKNFNLFRNPGVVLHNLRRERPKFARAGRWLSVAAVVTGLLGLAGCGASGTKPQLGAISVTDPSGAVAGQLNSVVINAKAAVSVAVAKDQENLGVSWTVICGGSSISPAPANPCGTIAPAYVGSSINMIYTAPLFIPVGNTVKITANVTSDPSITSSITLTIAPLPITIALTTPPPTPMGVSATALISATTTNDLVAAGVNWTVTCGSASCGGFQSGLPIPTQTASGGQITYTAPSTIPAGGTVTITATSVSDPSKSVSTKVTIAAVAVGVAQPSITVPVSTTANLTATVTFDSSNKGVDWVAPTCGNPGACGSLSQTHTASGVAVVYTAPASIPAGGTVTVVAKATANPSATATVTITVAPPPPISVTVAPPTAFAQVNGTTNLVATIANDPALKGADWTVSCGTAGACGSVTAHTASGGTAVYTAPAAVPAGGTVTVTATSTSDNTKSASATIAIVPPIAIAFAPALPALITAGTAASFTATVTNDVAAAGVDWTVSCTNTPCGSFSPSHTASGAATAFTAPITAPAGTVTITATSTASNTQLPVRVVSATVTIVPVIAVSFVPFAPSQMQVSDINSFTPAAVNLTAVVLNDTTNAGIDWSVCSSVATCGEFVVTPAVAATSTTPAANAVYAATLHTASGQVAAYIPPTQTPTPGGTVTITAKAHNPAATSSLATATAVVAIVGAPTGVRLQGVVQAGTKPVVGAAVSLYAAGTSGYSSASSPLIISGSSNQVVTGAGGQFTIPAGYACPSQSSQMFLVALGGNAGAGNNPNLAMMTALGSCGGLNSTVNIAINEVTTVASVWALAPFMSDYGHVGSSSSNATNGMANAFAQVNNLANILTGQALATTPAGNGIVPRSEINTLADILYSCDGTTGGAVGDGSSCGTLFNAANPGALTANAPINTLQAALNIAQNPSSTTSPGPGNLYGLLPTNGPFTPVLTTTPNDWTIALNLSGGGLGTRSAASALGIDGVGNVWITNSRFSSVTELNSMGAALSPTGTGTTQATAGGYQGGGLNIPTSVAIDPLGNAWIASSNGLSEWSPVGTAVSSSSGFSGGGLSNTKGIAIDGPGNVWVVNGGAPGSVSWFAGANATINGVPVAGGTPLSPTAGYTQGINNPSGGIGVDNAGTVWVLNSGDNSAAELSSASGSFIQSDYGYTQTVPIPIGSVLTQGVGTSVAIDNGGDVFLSNGSQLLELLSGGSSANFGGLGTASAANGQTFSRFLALDGAGHVWLMITGGNSLCPSSSSVVELNSGGAELNINSQGCGYLGSGVGASVVALAVDGSGNLWVLSGGAMTEFVGVAAPVVTPFSTGVQNKTLAKKP